VLYTITDACKDLKVGAEQYLCDGIVFNTLPLAGRIIEADSTKSFLFP